MRSCSCIFSAVGSAPSISEKSNFLFIGCYLFSSCLRFLSDYPCRFTGAPACPFPFVLVLASSPRQVVGTAATTSRRNRRSIEHPDEKCRSHVREVTAVGCLPVVELVIEYVQRFIGNEEPAAFPVDVDMVRAGTGTIAGVLRNRCRSLCVNRNRPGCSRYRFPCGGLCRNSPCLGSRVQLFPRAFKFGRHEVARPCRVRKPCIWRCLSSARNRAISSCCRAAPKTHIPCSGVWPRTRPMTSFPWIAGFPCSPGSPARCSSHVLRRQSSSPVSGPHARLPAVPAGVCHGRC